MPYVGDSKRALDEYTSEIFMGGKVCVRVRVCSSQFFVQWSISDRSFLFCCSFLAIHLLLSVVFCSVGRCHYAIYYGDICAVMISLLQNTISMHNTCEDSLLATPLIIDLLVLCEVCERISVQCHHDSNTSSSEDSSEKFHSVLSMLSYLLKAPLVPSGTPVVNALGAQRQCIVNIFRACIGLPPIDYMHLEHKVLYG